MVTKKIIIITGVAGMVGTNLLKKLINEKNTIIIGIDSLILGKKKFLSPYLNNKKFFFIKLDLSKKIKSKKIEKIIGQSMLSEVWMLAANSDIKKGVDDFYIDINNTFLTTVNTLNLLKNYLTKKTKIIFTSSSAVYGNIKKITSENKQKLLPISNYGSMKLSSECFLSSFSHSSQLNIFIFRFPNVIGNNLTHGIFYDMKNKIKNKKNFIKVLGNGEQQKPYSHVDEILECILYIKNKKHLEKLNYYNIGSNDSGVKVKKIVELMVKKLNSNKKIIYQKNNYGWIGDVPKYKYLTTKTNKTGFKFKLSSIEAVEKVIKDNI